MVSLVARTGELSVREFQEKLYERQGQLLCPVVLHRGEDFQKCSEAQDFPAGDALRMWERWGAIGGIGQCTLDLGKRLAVVGRLNIFYRKPTEAEIQYDLHNFCDQVFGRPIAEIPAEERERFATFMAGDTEHAYEGPLRVEKVVMAARVFPHDLHEWWSGYMDPRHIEDYTENVDWLSREGPLISSKGGCYTFFSAIENGAMGCMPGAFNAADWYSIPRLRPYGAVEKKDGRLLFYRGKSDEPEDYTDALYRRDSDDGTDSRELVVSSQGIEI